MVNYLKYGLCMVMVFLAGFTLAINYATLWPNPDYDAQEWKLPFAVFWGVFFAIAGGRYVRDRDGA